MLVPPYACNALPTPHIPPDTMACALPPPFHSPPRSGRSVGGPHVVCRLSAVFVVSRREPSPFFLLHAAQHSPVLPVPLFSFLQPIAPRRKKKKRKRIPNPEAITHTRPNQSQNRRKVVSRENTHHFFLICPREPTLNKVIDHLCHFAWGGLGEQNVSLLAAHPLDSRPPSSLSPHDSPGPSLGGVAFCKDPHRRQCVMRVCVRGMELGVKCHKGEVAATSTTPTGIMGW